MSCRFYQNRDDVLSFLTSRGVRYETVIEDVQTLVNRENMVKALCLSP